MKIKKTNKSLAMPSQSNNSNKVNKSSRTKQLNKHGSPRKFMMSSSISSTIKEVQGSSSGQKVQQVLTLSKLTGSTLQFSTLVEVRVLVFSPLVSEQFSRITALRFLTKLGQKLEGDEWRTVTGPVFPGKINLINYAWRQVLAIFSILGPQIDLILHI